MMKILNKAVIDWQLGNVWIGFETGFESATTTLTGIGFGEV